MRFCKTRKRFGLVAGLALTAAFVVMLAVPAEAAKKKASKSFFNSVEVRSSNLKPFKKWRGALKRYSKQKKKNKKVSCGP